MSWQMRARRNASKAVQEFCMTYPAQDQEQDAEAQSL
jgi:hypothetical protein